MTDDPAGFEWLEQNEFARLDGLPFADGETDWHVNEKMIVAAGSTAFSGLLGAFDGVQIEAEHKVDGLILQRGDASHEWLTLVVDEDSEVRRAFHVDGIGSDPEEFDASGVEVIAIGEELGDLDG